MHRLAYILLFAAACLPAWRGAAQDVSVQAFVNETVIGAEERLTYTLEIEGAGFSDVERPKAPETEGLAILQPIPSTQHNLSFINGVQKQSVAYQWSYRPLRTGKALIKPVAVSVRGRFLRTSAIEVEIVPQSQRPQRRVSPPTAGSRNTRPAPPPSSDNTGDRKRVGKEDMFIKVVPSTRQAFQNEQITVEYQLYFRPFIQPRESRLAAHRCLFRAGRAVRAG